MITEVEGARSSMQERTTIGVEIVKMANNNNLPPSFVPPPPTTPAPTAQSGYVGQMSLSQQQHASAQYAAYAGDFFFCA